METRAELDRTRVGYFGVSYGGGLTAVALAVEPRFKAGVAWSGGFSALARLPEIDAINFAPRVTTPVLMLYGRDDFSFPIETGQLPMFRGLGVREPDKRHVIFDGGHVFPFARVEKDTLEWFDHYLGVPK